METAFRTQKFDAADILGQSVQLIKLGAARLFPIAILSAIPQCILLYYNQSLPISDDPEVMFSTLGTTCGLSLVMSVISLYAYIAAVFTVEALVQGRPDGVLAAFRFALSRLLPVLLVFFVFMILTMLGMAILVIPGIILAIYLAFAIPAAALRNLNLPALEYSHKLVQGQWWRVFGILLGIGLLTGITTSLLNWIGGALFPVLGFGMILFYFLTSLVTFFFAVPYMVFFLNEDYRAHPLPAAPVEG